MSDRTSTAIQVRLTLWNRWVTPRKERTADGTTTVYFGVGKVAWWRNENGSQADPS